MISAYGGTWPLPIWPRGRLPRLRQRRGRNSETGSDHGKDMICLKKVEKKALKRPYIAVFDAKKRHIGHR